MKIIDTSNINLQSFFQLPEITLEDLYWQGPLLVVLYVAAKLLKKRFTPPYSGTEHPPGFSFWRKENAAFLWFFGFLTIMCGIGYLLKTPLAALQVAWVLTGLWLIVSMLAAHSRDRIVVRLIAISLYVVVTLHLLGWFDNIVNFLEAMQLTLGQAKISAFGVLTGVFVLVVMLWMVQVVSRFIENRIRSIDGISSSIKVLIGKGVKIVLIAAAFLIAVDSMGLDLTVLTVLGGGLGIGIGFGLQKIISNLVSGFILLTDKSIKPGDVIEIGDTYGWINNLSARYVSIITRDGTEHLIPNENLITQNVINWSFTNNLVRLRIPIGISYDSDLNKARELIIQAANSTERVLKDPYPKCHLIEFGNSSINLECRVWISDPSKGLSNIKSDILLKVWESFKENNIEIPYPQRDIHIKSVDGVNPFSQETRKKQTEAVDKTLP